MNLIFAELEAVDVLGVWSGAILAIILIVSALGGIVIRTGRGHIEAAISRQLETKIPNAVALALREVNVKLDGIRINQAELSAEIAVVRRLEVKIENGLSSRVERIETGLIFLTDAFQRQYGRWDSATDEDRRA